MHQQGRQQRPLPGATKRQRAVLIDHLKRPQDSKLDHVDAPPSTLPPVPNPSNACSHGHVYRPLTVIDRFSTSGAHGSRHRIAHRDRQSEEAARMTTTHRITIGVVLALALASAASASATQVDLNTNGSEVPAATASTQTTSPETMH